MYIYLRFLIVSVLIVFSQITSSSHTCQSRHSTSSTTAATDYVTCSNDGVTNTQSIPAVLTHEDGVWQNMTVGVGSEADDSLDALIESTISPAASTTASTLLPILGELNQHANSGGDGFAFVIQNGRNGSGAMGNGGGGLGERA